MSADEEARAQKLAANQSRFRRSNDRLERSTRTQPFEAAYRAPFLCECPDPGCFEAVLLSIEEYERVRAHPSWFLLAAGHEDGEADDERIVEAENGYAVVEKVGTVGAEAARSDGRQKMS